MRFDRPVTFQRLDGDEAWHDAFRAHAWVNKTQGSQPTDAGAMRSRRSLTFRIRWRPECRGIACEMQRWRVVYEGRTYGIVDTDDYMERHRTFEAEGESYGD